MNNKKRIGLIVSVIALVTLATAGVTFAYLSSTTATITNTFTAGDVQISLAESNFVQEDAHVLVPGASFDKNPTVTVLANSENCWVAVKVTVPKALDTLVTLDWNTTNWQLVKKITDPDNSTNYAYFYKYQGEVSKAATATQLAAVFNHVSVNTADTNAQLQGLTANDLKIGVQAYAIQSLSFADQATALAQWIPAD